MSEATKTFSTPESDSEVSGTSSGGSSLQIDEAPGYATTMSTASTSSASQGTVQQNQAESPAETREVRVEGPATAQKDPAGKSSETQEDQGETPAEPQKDRGETPAEPKKDQAEKPSETQEDQGETPTETQKNQAQRISETHEDRGETPAETQKDQGKSPSKAIWRCVSNVCCCRSIADCFRASQEAQENEIGTQDIEMKVQGGRFREEGRSAATSGNHEERSGLTSETQSSTPGTTSESSASGSTSRRESSASGYTSQQDMFPNMSRSQQEIYERLRDPEYEMLEARLYDERMARINARYLPIERTTHPWQPLEILDRETLMELWRPPPHVMPVEEKLSIEARRRRDLEEMAMVRQPREYAEAMRQQHTGDDDDSEDEDAEGTSSEFSSETARSRELAELERRQQMVHIEDDSEDQGTEECSEE